VPDDRVEPAAQVRDVGVLAQRCKRAEERLLDNVFGMAVRAKSARMGVELTSVTLDDRDECTIVPSAGELHEALVGL
jgi:hypothetical protein